MCLLIISEGKFPKESLIKYATDRNKDGAGIAFIENDKVRYHKGLDFDGIMEHKNVKSRMLIHARVATVGGIHKELTHPFPVTPKVELDLEGTTNAVLAHNGHQNNWKELLMNAVWPHMKNPPGEHWSDSRLLAALVQVHGPDVMVPLTDRDKVCILFGPGYKADGKNPVGREGWFTYGNYFKQEEGIWTSQDVTVPTYIPVSTPAVHNHNHSQVNHSMISRDGTLRMYQHNLPRSIAATMCYERIRLIEDDSKVLVIEPEEELMTVRWGNGSTPARSPKIHDIPLNKTIDQ